MKRQCAIKGCRRQAHVSPNGDPWALCTEHLERLLGRKVANGTGPDLPVAA